MKLFFRKTCWTLIVVICFVNNIHAKHTYGDLLSEKDNVKKAEIGLELLNNYRRNDYDSLKFVAICLLLDANGKEKAFPKAVGNWTIGTFYIKNGRLKEGIANIKKANDYFTKKGNLTLMSESLLEIGNGYFLSGDFKEAIKYYLKSIDIGNKCSDKTFAYAAKLSLGHSYCAIGDTAVGMFSMLQYKDDALKDHKYESVANAYALLGMVEMDRGNIPLSREYYEKSIYYGAKSSSKTILSHAYNNKAILHYNLNELDSSLLFFEKALRLRKRLNQHKDIIESYFNIASYYQGIEDYDNALYYFNQSIELSKQFDFKVDEVDALAEMITIYDAIGNQKEIDRINKRIEYLKTFINDQKSIDEDILDYAEEILNQSNSIGSGVVRSEEEKSYAFIWLLLGGAVVLILFGVLRKP